MIEKSATIATYLPGSASQWQYNKLPNLVEKEISDGIQFTQPQLFERARLYSG